MTYLNTASAGVTPRRASAAALHRRPGGRHAGRCREPYPVPGQAHRASALRPGAAHGVTVAVRFRAVTTEPELPPRLPAAEALPAEDMALVRRRLSRD